MADTPYIPPRFSVPLTNRNAAPGKFAGILLSHNMTVIGEITHMKLSLEERQNLKSEYRLGDAFEYRDWRGNTTELHEKLSWIPEQTIADYLIKNKQKLASPLLKNLLDKNWVEEMKRECAKLAAEASKGATTEAACYAPRTGENIATILESNVAVGQWAGIIYIPTSASMDVVGQAKLEKLSPEALALLAKEGRILEPLAKHFAVAHWVPREPLVSYMQKNKHILPATLIEPLTALVAAVEKGEFKNIISIPPKTEEISGPENDRIIARFLGTDSQVAFIDPITSYGDTAGVVISDSNKVVSELVYAQPKGDELSEMKKEGRIIEPLENGVYLVKTEKSLSVPLADYVASKTNTGRMTRELAGKLQRRSKNWTERQQASGMPPDENIR